MSPEARAARERKQKIFVVVGGILLLALLAFQLPRYLGGSSSPTAASTTTDQSTLTTAEPDVSAGVPTPVVATGLPDTDRPLAAEPGKLRSFRVFDRKDPFVQQVKTSVTAGSQSAAGVGASGARGSGSGSGVEGGKSDPAGGEVPQKGFTVGGSPAAAVTVISVNGSRQALAAGAAFPASDPVFVLVAENPESKTAVVGIVGGAYASGSKTTKLKVGKPLILVNTATGARYKVVLVAVGNGSASTPAAPSVTPTSPQPSP